MGGLIAAPAWPAVARAIVVIVVAMLMVGRDLGWLGLRLPENRRQVTDQVIRNGGRLGSLQFGFEMGTGLRTYVTASLPYVLVVTVALTPYWWTVPVVAAGFACGRTVAVYFAERLEARSPRLIRVGNLFGYPALCVGALAQLGPL